MNNRYTVEDIQNRGTFLPDDEASEDFDPNKGIYEYDTFMFNVSFDDKSGKDNWKQAAEQAHAKLADFAGSKDSFAALDDKALEENVKFHSVSEDTGYSSFVDTFAFANGNKRVQTGVEYKGVGCQVLLERDSARGSYLDQLRKSIMDDMDYVAENMGLSEQKVKPAARVARTPVSNAPGFEDYDTGFDFDFK